jgi:DNA helicase-2/ATP-dependent DNA helicase PcrA
MPRLADKFLAYYRQLNPAQKQAVDTIEGPAMVIAGPGTGKTQIITLRIANILRQTDTSPDSILALTFTNSGVHSMRERLIEMIGSVAYRVEINTFHTFCNELIHDFPEEFPRIVGSRSASRVDQIRLLEEVISRSDINLLRPYGEPFYHLFAVMSEIERLKKENLDPDDFDKFLSQLAEADEKSIQKNRELAILYRAYETALRREKLYDFADMIMEVTRTLARDKDFLLRLQEQYQYILADEHQDANQSQNQLLELLSNFHPDPNLFIVGDEKQAIFQFQGASLDNFNYFQKLFPAAKLIYLTANYRSTKIVLDAAHSLISSGPKLEAKRPFRPSEASQPILLYPFSSAENEYRFLATDIKSKIKSGVLVDEIAVLYRDNQDAFPVAESLERAGLPFVVQSDADVLTDIDMQKLLLLFRAIYHFGEDEWLYKVLPLDFLGFDNLDIYQLAQFCQTKKISAYAVLRKNRDFKIFHDFYCRLEHWQRDSHNLNLTDLFGEVLEESGLTAYLVSRPAAADKLAKLQTLYSEMKELVSQRRSFNLADFITYLDTLEKHNVSLNQNVTPNFSGVRLMTMHKAKGLEFDYVYIINTYDGHLGNKRRRETFKLNLRGSREEDNDAERRLFYVALTRARKQVIISYTKLSRDGKARLVSELVQEIDPKLVRTMTPIEKQTPNLPQKRREQKVPLGQKAYLNQLFLERGFSVTDLNNYLRCPLQYFFNNLLRLTKVQNKHLMYGTAIHATLKDFFDAYREEKFWREKKLKERFRYHLEREALSDGDFQESLKKGERALGGYFRSYNKKWPDNITNEFNIRGILLTPEIKLNGKIDKLELSRNNNEVRVVDYKTGKPKTRNYILGLTKSEGSGDYHRQLVFYKLLLDNFGPAGKYRVVSGVIDFIEPDEKGRYHQEEFAVSEDEVAVLRELISQTVAEIMSLKFLTLGCGKPDCDACKLYRMMKNKTT